MTGDAGALLALPGTHAVECFRQEPLDSLRQIWCFPHAGSGAGEFSGWLEHAGPHDLVCAVRLPGRERRMADKPVPELAGLIPSLVTDIAPLIRPGAVFYGQCLGAVLAFEVIAELQRRGAVVPSRLYVASQTAPGLPGTGPLAGDGLLDQATLRQMAQDMAGMPEELCRDDELWELIEPALSADIQLLADYTCWPPPIGVPITALLGSADDLVSAAEARAWAEHTRAGFTLRIIPDGGHLLSRTSGADVIDIIHSDGAGQS